MNFHGENGKFVNTHTCKQNCISRQLSEGIERTCPDVYLSLFKEHLSDNLWNDKRDIYTHKGKLVVEFLGVNKTIL